MTAVRSGASIQSSATHLPRFFAQQRKAQVDLLRAPQHGSGQGVKKRIEARWRRERQRQEMTRPTRETISSRCFGKSSEVLNRGKATCTTDGVSKSLHMVGAFGEPTPSSVPCAKGQEASPPRAGAAGRALWRRRLLLLLLPRFEPSVKFDSAGSCNSACMHASSCGLHLSLPAPSRAPRQGILQFLQRTS